MSPDDVKARIENGIPGSEVTVSGEGCNLSVVVVSDSFSGKTMVAEQKMVYATVNDLITSGELHALAIKAYTPEEWQQESQKS
ncbi:MAG: BolA/IbaG family iron-sulfur metabolism protein [Gammaproteobacteria bacterium]|nr:BolA/IbaG family iron-sulfur metabolism protein [Gammaproteobacteria bacterium]